MRKPIPAAPQAVKFVYMVTRVHPNVYMLEALLYENR